jgi:hypothetical protein
MQKSESRALVVAISGKGADFMLVTELNIVLSALKARVLDNKRLMTPMKLAGESAEAQEAREDAEGVGGLA